MHAIFVYNIVEYNTSYNIFLSLSPPSPVRALRGVFLKVEDLSRLYRPLVLEMKRWPRPLCHASHKALPFDPPHLAAKSPEQQLQQKKEMRGEERVEKRPGHCECCSVKFDNLQMVSYNVNVEVMFCFHNIILAKCSFLTTLL